MPTTIARIMATQLIPLPEVERLSSSVIRILGGNPGKASLPPATPLHNISHPNASATDSLLAIVVNFFQPSFSFDGE